MKIINLLLIIGMIIGTLYFVVFDYDGSRILTYLAIFPVLCLPLLLKKTKYRLGNREKFGYYLFVFGADFLGCVANLYNTIWWYDILIHFSSGIFIFLTGLFLVNRLKLDELGINIKILFCFCICMSVAGMWELFEFGADSLLGMDLQHASDTGVVDTMIDMVCGFVGGVICSIIYKIYNK